MNKWSILLLVAVICDCEGQNYERPCPNATDILNQCVKQHQVGNDELQVGFAIFDATNTITFAGIQPETVISVCQDKPKMKSFFDCLSERFFSCISPAWHKAYPDVNKVKRSFDSVCGNIPHVRTECVGSLPRHITFSRCTSNTTSKQPDVSSVDRYLAYICGVYSVFIPCFEKSYGTCPDKTTEVWKQVLTNQIPTGCNAVSMTSTLKPPLSLLIIVMFCACFIKY